MRITFLTQYFQPEPGIIHGLPLAKWLEARGHSVHVVTGYPNYPTGDLYPGYSQRRVVSHEEIDAIAVTRLPLVPSHHAGVAARILNYGSFALSLAAYGAAVDRVPCDVIYAYATPPTVGAMARLWSRRRRVPYVLHVADVWPEAVLDSGLIDSRFLQRIARRGLEAVSSTAYLGASCVTALSDGFGEMLVRKGVPPNRVKVIHNWADESVFRPVDLQQGMADRLSTGGDKVTILYVGNIGPLQGLDTAVRAAAKLTDVPQFQLALSGSGVAEPDLRRLAESLGAGNVTFMGRTEFTDVPYLSRAADGLLVSLKGGAFSAGTIPSKTQAALAMGRPVLAAIEGDAARLLRSAGCALVCAPDDADALADVFRRFVQMSRADREAMGTAGRKFYEERLSLDVGGATLETVLASAIDERRAVVS